MVLPKTISKKETQREGTDYEPYIIDRLNSALVWRSTQLGLSLVWLCSLGYRGRGPDCRPHYVPNWTTLKGRAVRLRHHDHVATNPSENTMMKQIEIYGQWVALYSPDKGRTWSSSPQSIVAFGQRKKMLLLELKQRFARMD